MFLYECLSLLRYCYCQCCCGWWQVWCRCWKVCRNVLVCIYSCCFLRLLVPLLLKTVFIIITVITFPDVDQTFQVHYLAWFWPNDCFLCCYVCCVSGSTLYIVMLAHFILSCHFYLCGDHIANGSISGVLFAMLLSVVSGFFSFSCSCSLM